jgi:hypothetical protein
MSVNALEDTMFATREGVAHGREMMLGKGITHAIVIDANSQLVIIALSGCLWVTVEGHPDDFVATPQVPLVLRGEGLVVIEGISDWNVFATEC